MSSSDWLAVVRVRGAYEIRWVIADDVDEKGYVDDYGATLGEWAKLPEEKPTDTAEARAWVAEKIAYEAASRQAELVNGALRWECLSDAEAVVAHIELAWKSKTLELPAWAITALTEGWKPPEGWEP